MTRNDYSEMLRDRIRKRLLKYERKAFRMLPSMDRPRILDIGCGSGISTLELARLTQGEIIGIDIDQAALDKFVRNIEKAGLTERVQVVNCSMFDMNFADESFDIIWAEGSVYPIGFERGLREWRPLLRPGGFIPPSRVPSVPSPPREPSLLSSQSDACLILAR